MIIFFFNYSQILRGNSNTYLVEKQKLELPFVASRVRFVPYSKHPRTVCMRVEIYGCVWERKWIFTFCPTYAYIRANFSLLTLIIRERLTISSRFFFFPPVLLFSLLSYSVLFSRLDTIYRNIRADEGSWDMRIAALRI